MYGDWNVIFYHNAIDIPASHGTPVLAVESGIVTSTGTIDTFHHCWVVIKKSVTDTTAWSYYHIVRKDSSIAKDSIINAGDTVGHVCDYEGPGDPNDHIHFQLTDTFWIFHSNLSYLNPQDSFSPAIPLQIPQIYSGRSLPHHPYKIYYVSNYVEDTTNSYEKTLVHDSVDIIIRAGVNALGDTCSGVHALGYGITPLTAGGNIPFRKMFDMHGNMELSRDSIKHCLTFAGPPDGPSSMSSHWKKYYVVTNCDDSTPQPEYGISNIQENCWPTKINIAGTGNADSIEDARFPDGYYITTVKVWSHSGDSAVAVDTVHVDNFNPKVKKTDPESLFAFVPTKKHKVWCIFSEQMDTTTLTTANIKIQSLKSDSFNYPIKNITYVKDSFKLWLTVDSFRFQDTVQVRLLDGVKDLAGKSIQGSKQTVAYSWTFVVGVLQLTDNDLWDIQPDVYHGNIVWTQAPVGNDQGEIVFYDFYNRTLDTISPGGGIHNSPYIYQNKVAWIGYGWGSTNPVYYYNGITAQEIAPANKGRYSMAISEGGVAWRAYMYASGSYDTIWAEYYNPDSNKVYVLDTFLDYYGRYYGRVDIDGSEVVWDGEDPTVPGYGKRELYRHYNGLTENFSQDTVYDDATADISNGQIFWLKDRGWSYLWFYDGINKRLIKDGSDLHSPYLHNGSMSWIKGVNMPGWWYLYFFDGRDTLQLRRQRAGWNNYAFQSVGIHNNQVVFLRLVYEKPPSYVTGYYGASLYDGEQLIHFTTDTLDRGNSNRIEVHDGFVVYDAWDGNDYEIYLYISDTLFTPPAVVKNLQGEVLGGKSPAKKVKLTWKANTEPDLIGYKIYRSAVSYQYGTTPYVTIFAPETTFIDTLPLEGMNYYVATAYDNLNNESGFSNQTSVFIDNIPPAVPSNLVASYDSINQIVNLSWRSSPDTDLKLYKIYRSETSGNYTTPLDSVFKPDTTFIDSTIFLNKIYYYVVSAVDTNKNESGFSNEDTVIVPFFVASDFGLATAYNSGHKIISNEGGKSIHFVYANEGWLGPVAGIYYCHSSDSGKSFSSGEFVGGPGMYPSLAIDTAGNPCASWVSGSYICYTYWTTSWAPPDTMVLPVENVSPPSMAVDTTNAVHLVFSQYYWLPSDTGDLVYLEFPRQHFEDVVAETLLTNIFCRTPSLVVDLSRNLHILWQGEKSICYRQKDLTGWQNIDTIYTTTTNERLFPVIDFYGVKINTVWQDKDSLGNLEIYSRMKTDIGWDMVKKVAVTSGESRFPTLSGAHYCLWQDNSAGNWEVYMSAYVDTLGSWTIPENISNSLIASVYSHSAYSLIDTTSAKLYCLWTEGDTIPYTIMFQKLDVSPVAKIFVDVGQEIQSPCCIERDGYWKFGDKPYQTVDWDYENLKYKITGLNPEKVYRMDLAYYFENNPRHNMEDAEGHRLSSPSLLPNPIKDEGISAVHGTEVPNPENDKGIGRIIQALVVDGIPLDTAFITPNKLVRTSVWLKKESYADGEIVSEIQKVKGKRVVCAEIGLFEFPGETKTTMVSGPMGEEAFLSKPFFFEKIFPNPARNVLRIRFNSPDNRRVIIRMYDVSGRLMHKEDLLQTKIGKNEVLLMPKNLACGIYFIRLETEGYHMIEKIILLK